MDDEELYQEVWEYVEEFSKEVAKLESKLPYNVNVIDELHANENAHSRILIKLLQYPRDGKLPILESFKSLINGRLSGSGQPLLPLDGPLPNISGQPENIDALIEETKDKSYAIIIENKIYDATDQSKQIDRYVESVKDHGFKDDSIYVIYLTKDGNKEVADYSFDASRKILDYKDENDTGRFIPLNYRNNILPWLEKDVLPHCMIKEEMLISALQQYIDHLKGSFNLRKGEMSMANEIIDEMFGLKDYTLDDNVQKIILLMDKYEKTKRFDNYVLNYRNKLLDQMYGNFHKEFKEKLPSTNWDGSRNSDYSINCFSFDKRPIKDNELYRLFFEIERDGCSNYFYWDFAIGYDYRDEDKKEVSPLGPQLKKEFEKDKRYSIDMDNEWSIRCINKRITMQEFFKGMLDSSIVDKTLKAYEDIKSHLRNIGLLNE